MSVMDNVEIQSILPHRYPFLLVDRIRENEIKKSNVVIPKCLI